MRKSKNWIMAVAILLLPSLAQAAVSCWVYAPVGEPLTSDYYFDANQLPPFNPNAQDGAVLADVTLTSTNTAPIKMVQCQYPVLHLYGMASILPSFRGNTFQSGIEGVGVKILTQGGEEVPYTKSDALYPDYTVPTGGYRGKIRFIFTKIGSITGKGALQGEFAYFWANGHSDKFSSFRWSGDVQIKAPTCAAATTGTQTVELGTYPAKDFKGIGSVSKLVPFAINLTCSDGTENALSKIFITLTDNTNAANMSNTLSLSPDSAAKGLGIQVFKDSTLLGYGPADTTNKWYAGTTGNGFFSIPLSARFIQTAQTVTSGIAKGRMTFTISYQ